MTHREIRSALAALLRGIPEIGRVHEFERYSKRLEDLKAHYVTTLLGASAQQLRGWFLRRTRSDYAGATFCPVRNDIWEIRGFMALEDGGESELQFDDLVDSVIQVFFEVQPDILGLRIADSEAGQRCALVQSQPVLFGGVLCHSATLVLKTEANYGPL